MTRAILIVALFTTTGCATFTTAETATLMRDSMLYAQASANLSCGAVNVIPAEGVTIQNVMGCGKQQTCLLVGETWVPITAVQTF